MTLRRFRIPTAMNGQEKTREEDTKETEEGWGGEEGEVILERIRKERSERVRGEGACCYGRVERSVGVHVKVNARRVVDQRFARGVPVKQNLVFLFFFHAYSRLFYFLHQQRSANPYEKPERI